MAAHEHSEPTGLSTSAPALTHTQHSILPSKPPEPLGKVPGLAKPSTGCGPRSFAQPGRLAGGRFSPKPLHLPPKSQALGTGRVQPMAAQCTANIKRFKEGVCSKFDHCHIPKSPLRSAQKCPGVALLQKEHSNPPPTTTFFFFWSYSILWIIVGFLIFS